MVVIVFDGVCVAGCSTPVPEKPNGNTKQLTTQIIANSIIGEYIDPRNVIEASEQMFER